MDPQLEDAAGKLNNYNSCGAIIAGFERAPVHRLSDTKILSSSKAYRSVWALMSTSRSYSTYRLAFQNTYAQKIAFLPTHLSDLFRADQGNPTFVDAEKTLINWKKFDLLGGMILEVQQSQQMPHGTLRRMSRAESVDESAGAAGAGAAPRDLPRQEKKSHDMFYMDLRRCPLAKELVLKSERYESESDIIARSWAIEPPQGQEPHRRRFESLFSRLARD
ncbi:hypothetical protein KEM52_001307 [Ascosphaera acerosa]|nr:hypothetical protein KEM52_001307 [Ascosphaera acerosa]